MKYGALSAMLLWALLPAVALGAGFAKQSLFLSKASVSEGETVLIHAILGNDSAEAFSGELVFADNEKNIGSVPISLAAGEAHAASVSWKPAAGSHTISAKLQTKAGAVAEERSETFNVKERPRPAEASRETQVAAVESSQKIREGIASYAPAVAGVTTPFFALVDSGRAAAAEALEGQLAGVKKNLATSSGAVLSAESAKSAAQDPLSAFWSILWTLYFYLLTILLFLLSSAGIFYPLLAVAFLYILWRTFRRFRRA